MDLAYLTEEVKRIALEAGKYLLTERSNFDRNKIEKKGAHDYVSYVDKNSEKLIVNKLHALLPKAGFITEEGTATLKGEDYCWVIDPLDGTSNFIHDNAPFCVSIALKDKEEILLGVVYECTRNELFWANKNSKACLNGTEITVTETASVMGN